MDIDASGEPPGRCREDSSTNEHEIVLFGSDEQQQELPSKKRHKQQTKQPAASDSFTTLSFWQQAFSSDTSDAVPPTENIDEIAPEQGTTEMVEFMDSERSKDARKADRKDDGAGLKKSRSVLGDDEAVWGANSAMGPHFQEDDESI